MKLSVVKRMLSKHYITQRSVIFLVDTEYSKLVYRDLANKYMLNMYDSLSDDDYFGFIPIGFNVKVGTIRLSKKSENSILKKRVLREFTSSESNLHLLDED